MKPATKPATLEKFDALPDDALVPGAVAGLLLGISEWTLRRSPPVPRIQITPKRIGYRVGDLRALARGTLTDA
jgi:hypothetical protein